MSLEPTPENKRKWWGNGPWVDEPNEEHFEYNGLKCFIKRVFVQDGQNHIFGGYLCGYVSIPKDHIDYEKDCFLRDNHPYDVHGGLTFSDYIQGHWYIGFDCSHSDDIVPCMKEFFKKFDEDLKEKYPNFDLARSRIFDRSYKTWDYVLEQIKDLAGQVNERGDRNRLRNKNT